MSDALRSAVTLSTLVLLVVVGGTWGWAALTKPFPKDEETPICVDATVAQGLAVTRDQVVVSVYNGSRRTGLASSTQDLLVERGFVAGATGNAPEQVAHTQIWADDPQNPATRLVKRQFVGAKIIPDKPTLGIGVVVVVGQDFKQLRKKQVESVTARKDSRFCQSTSAD